MSPTRRIGSGTPGVVWTALLLVVTAVLVPLRDHVPQVQVVLVYLLVVLGGSASGSRPLGLLLAGTSSLLIDYFFQTPYDELAVGKPLDWQVLLTFLVAATVATQLLALAREQAEAARQRAGEIDRLAALGAETLSLGTAEASRAAIAELVRDHLRVAGAEIWARDGAEGPLERVASATAGPAPPPPPGRSLLQAVAAQRHAAGERTDGSFADLGPFPGEAAPEGERLHGLLLPLVAHGRGIGVLRLTDPAGVALESAGWRFLVAIAYYAALAVERVRLAAEAEHAEALRETDRLKDALLASVSHDLRTPLTTIKALAHDLAGAGDERAEVIEQQADRLNHMVADLLELSRLQAGGVPLQIEVDAAEDLVGAAIQHAAGALGTREVRTRLPSTDEVPLARYDVVASLRVLTNLLENAVKYSPPGTPIDVEVRTAGAWLEIAVADRGPGVEPAERERIFQPFYRPPSVPADAGGAGLGLAIARRLAQAQGGALEYAERPGGGSIFTLRLPAAAADELAGT